MKVYAKEKELVKYIRAEFKERFFQERWDLSFICILYKGVLSSALFLLTKQDGATISQQPLLNVFNFMSAVFFEVIQTIEFSFRMLIDLSYFK